MAMINIIPRIFSPVKGSENIPPKLQDVKCWKARNYNYACDYFATWSIGIKAEIE